MAGGERCDMARHFRRPWPRTERGRPAMPPWRSASVTTPTGSDTQLCIVGTGRPAAAPARSGRARPARRSRRRCRTAGRRAPAGSISGVQPVAARSASVSRSTISSSMPTCSRMMSRNSAPFCGGAAGLGCDQARARHGAVAHLVAANAERRDGAGDRGVRQAPGRRHALAEPDDARKRVDDAESRRPDGRAISRRQLLVPRSSAA